MEAIRDYFRLVKGFRTGLYDPEVPCEQIVAGPHWLWGHGELLSYGWFQASAATHLLGVEKNWAPFLAGSHAGRMALLVASGMFDPRLMPMPDRLPARTTPSHAWLAHTDTYEHATALLAVTVTRALTQDRIPVFHNIPCNETWVTRSAESRFGVLDWRLVQTPDGRCWPSNAGFDSCFVHKHFAWDFMLDNANQSRVRRTLPSIEDAKTQCSQWF
jgi:hypothetical protein